MGKRSLVEPMVKALNAVNKDSKPGTFDMSKITYDQQNVASTMLEMKSSKDIIEVCEKTKINLADVLGYFNDENFVLYFKAISKAKMMSQYAMVLNKLVGLIEDGGKTAVEGIKIFLTLAGDINKDANQGIGNTQINIVLPVDMASQPRLIIPRNGDEEDNGASDGASD